jgi:hypothetical protein
MLLVTEVGGTEVLKLCPYNQSEEGVSTPAHTGPSESATTPVMSEEAAFTGDTE